MEILLITANGSGIYPYIENSIENAFRQLSVRVNKINQTYNQETVEFINSLNPDLVMTLVGYKTDKKLIEYLQSKGFLLAVWLTEDPFYMDYSLKILNDFNIIFTVDYGAYLFYKKEYPIKKVFHLPLGTDPAIYHPLNEIDNAYDLCLVGYPYPERVELVDYILKKTQYTIIVAGPLWKRHLQTKHYKKRLKIINKWITPTKVNELFNLSKIILNPHRSYHFYKNKNSLGIKNISVNNRTFDIAACGAFQLISNQADIHLHFALPTEIVSFSNKESCVNLIDYYMADEERRKEISKKAYSTVLENHTFLRRNQNIIDIIRYCK